MMVCNDAERTVWWLTLDRLSDNKVLVNFLQVATPNRCCRDLEETKSGGDCILAMIKYTVVRSRFLHVESFAPTRVLQPLLSFNLSQYSLIMCNPSSRGA